MTTNMFIIVVLSIIKLSVSLAETKEHPCDGWIIHKDKCYKYTVKETSYKLAIDYCKELEGTVLKIKNPEENRFITKLLADDFLIWTDVWLSITLANKSRIVLLDDGTEPLYTNWAPNQPDMNLVDESCTEIMFGKWHNDWIDMNTKGKGMWNDVVCNDTNAVICEKALPLEYNGCGKA